MASTERSVEIPCRPAEVFPGLFEEDKSAVDDRP